MVMVARYSSAMSSVSTSIMVMFSSHSSTTLNMPPRLRTLAIQPSRAAMASTSASGRGEAMAAWVAVRPLACGLGRLSGSAAPAARTVAARGEGGPGGRGRGGGGGDGGGGAPARVGIVTALRIGVAARRDEFGAERID